MHYVIASPRTEFKFSTPSNMIYCNSTTVSVIPVTNTRKKKTAAWFKLRGERRVLNPRGVSSVRA